MSPPRWLGGAPLSGVLAVEGMRHEDDRGSLVKVLTADALRAREISVTVDQVLVTDNPEAGTVRGLHYQVTPHEETKILWVTRGRLLDVLVDVRPQSATYGQWRAVELSGDEDVAVHVPRGVAHGYQTLEPDTSITYLVAGTFSARHARTLRWDDPDLGIPWPLPASRISEKDAAAAGWPPS